MNYFNYFTEIEDAFVRRRGKHLFLSPIDWALMETWKEQEIPLHIVLRGVERSFDSFEARPRKRSVKSLLYCQEEVEAQHAEWLDSRVGANPVTDTEGESIKTPFSKTAVREHLQRSRKHLSDVAQSREKQNNDELSEALVRAANLLAAIENDFDTGANLDTRRLEDSLAGLERMLSEALLSVTSSSDLETAKSELKNQLKPYRSHMDPAVYNTTLENLLLKRLREHAGVPRLSLFYL
jgi:hypothetical protein